MAELKLPALHTDLLRALRVARRAHDKAVIAFRSATIPGDKERAREVLHGLADTINAVQGCAYTVGEAIRADGVAGTLNDQPGDTK